MPILRSRCESCSLSSDGIVSQFSRAANSTQTTAFTMGLQHLADLFRTDMATVVKTIEGLTKGLVASRMMSIGHLSAFMGLL